MKKILTVLLLLVTFVSTSQISSKITEILVINSNKELDKVINGDLKLVTDIHKTTLKPVFLIYEGTDIKLTFDFLNNIQTVTDVEFGKVSTAYCYLRETKHYVSFLEFPNEGLIMFEWNDKSKIIIVLEN